MSNICCICIWFNLNTSSSYPHFRHLCWTRLVIPNICSRLTPRVKLNWRLDQSPHLQSPAWDCYRSPGEGCPAAWRRCSQSGCGCWKDNSELVRRLDRAERGNKTEMVALLSGFVSVLSCCLPSGDQLLLSWLGDDLIAEYWLVAHSGLTEHWRSVLAYHLPSW